MFDTIKQVVTDSIEAQGGTALTRPYSRQIDAIVADICTHISKCGEDVIAQAQANEIDEDAVRAVLVEAGLAVEREPEVEENHDGGEFSPELVDHVALGAVEARISAIEGTLDGVATRLDSLIRLAESRFGSLNI